MDIAYNQKREVINVSEIVMGEVYGCIHCGCEMVPAALNSSKISAHFKAKNSHEDNCEVKLLNTSTRFNGKDSSIEKVYESILKGQVKSISKEVDRDKNPNREKRNVYVTVKNLKQLVTFCLSNHENRFIGGIQIKDFFIDKRTHNTFSSFENDKLYLISARFKKYLSGKQTFVLMYPIGLRTKEVLAYFTKADDYYETKSQLFDDLDVDDRFKDIYVLAKANRKGNLIIYDKRQIFFKNSAIS